MDTRKKNKYLGRWEEIQGEKAKLGLQESYLLSEIRLEVPGGAGGDLQFCKWALDNLGPGNTKLWLKKAKAPQVLGDTFKRLRNWEAAAALLNFKKGERRKIVRAITATRPTAVITRSVICTTGYKLGLRSSSAQGRPSTLDLHQKIDRLIAFILHLYSEYDLPNIPDDVRKAMDTSLAKAKGDLKALDKEMAAAV